ncbi:MAG TPA: 2-oxoglutarate and iron-dependent oxygenase domain-containing protein, partial [Stellaceae bacterium]|nr:2-oxoglutarate and iron-dependent oxygenase domain-containing protein [Stellaceae bacterium]
MTSSIPVIDLSAALGGGAAAKRQAAREINRACREIGFFTITGHGVPIAALDALRDKAHGFFS